MTSKIIVNIGKMVQVFREVKHYTVTDLSNRTIGMDPKVNRSRLKSIEMGAINVQMRELSSICRALDITMMELTDKTAEYINKQEKKVEKSFQPLLDQANRKDEVMESKAKESVEATAQLRIAIRNIGKIFNVEIPEIQIRQDPPAKLDVGVLDRLSAEIVKYPDKHGKPPAYSPFTNLTTKGLEPSTFVADQGTVKPIPGFKEEVAGPDHYHGTKVLDLINEFDLTFGAGNAVKYIFRHRKKHEKIADQIKDLRKAKYYIEHEIELLGKEK